MFPLRGLARHAPPEGDYLITCEVDWLVSPPGNAVQFSVSGNSPVALSQIVALAVDNSLSGADVQFIFSDSGFKLTVPAHNQLVAPVFTNGLTFIASAQSAIVGDVTIFQILNFMPPPVPIAPSILQNHANVVGVPLQTNGVTSIVPAGVNGTLNSLQITISAASGAAGAAANLSLIDGTSRLIWATSLALAASQTQNFQYSPSNLAVRFVNGLSLQVSLSSFTGDWIDASVYYSTP